MLGPIGLARTIDSDILLIPPVIYSGEIWLIFSTPADSFELSHFKTEQQHVGHLKYLLETL